MIDVKRERMETQKTRKCKESYIQRREKIQITIT